MKHVEALRKISPKRIVCFEAELQTGFEDTLRGSYEVMKEPVNFASGRTSRNSLQVCLATVRDRDFNSETRTADLKGSGQQISLDTWPLRSTLAGSRECLRRS
jgi:hypothetical protein